MIVKQITDVVPGDVYRSSNGDLMLVKETERTGKAITLTSFLHADPRERQRTETFTQSSGMQVFDFAEVAREQIHRALMFSSSGLESIVCGDGGGTIDEKFTEAAGCFSLVARLAQWGVFHGRESHTLGREKVTA